MPRQIKFIAAILVAFSQTALGQELVSFQEATQNGSTRICSVNFESTEEIAEDKPVIQLKAALLTRKLENGIFIELVVQLTKFQIIDGKVDVSMLVPATAWLRTSKDHVFVSGGRPHTTDQQFFRDVSTSPKNTKLLWDFIGGSTASIGFNYHVGEFDKVIHFRSRLTEEDRASLRKCLNRIFDAKTKK